MLPEDLMHVLADQGLTDAARLIATRLYAMGDEWHELAPDDFSRMVSGYPRVDTVRKHLRQIELAGYVERRAGGRGHSDRFRFAFSAGQESESKTDSAGESSGAKAPVVGEGGGDTPPVSPPELSPDAEAAITDKFKGCRGALRDYLLARVPPDRQVGYVQAVSMWLDGFPPFRKKDGGNVLPDELVKWIAWGLNSLLSGPEKMGRPLGDVDNLRTKLEVTIRKAESHDRPESTSSEGSGEAGRGGGAEAGRYAHRVEDSNSGSGDTEADEAA